MEVTKKAICEDYLARGYHPGSIVRVAMRNFLTYTDTVAYPGPQLNVVLGPNGTGKSALTHAICLACGGAPKSIGRSDDIKQFVRRNSEANGKSFCEVDILLHDSVRTVRRAINSENNSSTWTMGGRPSTQKDVKEFMQSMNIDVDNLNSFMPQDKVGSFTQQTAQGILFKTLQSIDMRDGSGRTLADEQMDLASFQNTSRVKENEVREKRLRVQTLTSELQSMEGEVRRMRQRSELEEVKDLYQIKLVVVDAENCEQMVIDKQKVVDTATEQLNQAQTLIEPLETKNRDLKRDITILEKQAQAVAKGVDTLEDSTTRLQEDIDACSVRMDTTIMALNSLDASRRQLQDRLRASEEEVARIELLKSEAEARLPQDQARFAAINAELKEVDNALAAANNASTTTELQKSEKLDEIREIQRQVNNFTDPKHVFLRKTNRFRDVQKVYDWIQNNSHRFKGDVIGPIGMHIKVDSPEVARMLETAVGAKRMMTFLTERKEDYNLINRELRARSGLGLKFSLVQINNSSNMTGTFSHGQLAEFGRECGGIVRYLNDDVPAPSHMPVMVRSFLQSFVMLHKVIYVKSDASSDIDISKLPSRTFDILCSNNEFRFMLFTIERNGQITKVAGTKSQYNRSAPVTIVTNESNENFFLAVGAADREEELAEKKAALEILKSEIVVIETTSTEIAKKLTSLTQVSQELRQKRSLCQNELKMVGTYTRQLENEQRKIGDWNRQLSTSVDSERQAHKVSLSLEVKNYQKYLISLNRKVQSGFAQSIGLHVAHQRLRTQRSAYNSTELELRRANEGLEEFQQLKLNAEKERKLTQEIFQELDEKLRDLERKSGGPKKFEKLYAKCIQECPEESYEDIEMKITEITKMLDKSMKNDNLLAQYETIKTTLAVEEASLKVLVDQLEQGEAKIDERLHKWEELVANLTEKINALFKKFMSELNYHGEVCLRRINGLDTYEMQMNVSFRGESDIAPLSGQRHSGGERAVATIMYLMALQGLTSAPFRVVDEINQGMDERNERLVFDIIVRNSCVSKEERALNALAFKPQYFLVSPKLLQGLRAMETDGVTVLMVWNGTGVIPFNVGDIVSRLKSLKRGHEEVDDDSGNEVEENNLLSESKTKKLR